MKKLDDIVYDRRFGLPVVKDGCGVFGMLRKAGAPMIPSQVAIKCISCIKYRGSDLGAGYAAFRASDGGTKESKYNIQAFVTEEAVASSIRTMLEESVGPVETSSLRRLDSRGADLSVWEASLRPRGDDDDGKADELVEKAVESVNASLFKNDFQGRIFSYGRYLSVYKEVGYPTEVAQMWGLDRDLGMADMWMAHTRQPTNSPGSLPIFSHPFASMNTAIVHNGDISSYGSNMELLNSWGLKSHVGTDSEVIAQLLDHMLRINGLSIREAATVLTNPFERGLPDDMRDLLYRYRGARLDGPFAVVAGYADGEDIYLVALTDRFKFRPLLIGEDENYFYVASEENQIRIQSRHAKIWTPEPGAFFIASMKKGIIEPGSGRGLGIQSSALSTVPTPQAAGGRGGRPNVRSLDARGVGFREINDAISAAYAHGDEGIMIENCTGQRYLGIGISPRSDAGGHPFKIQMTGFPGNCLGNLNDGASFEIFGNVADDLADTMHGGSVIVHGNTRDVTGQALQGGSIFVRGTVGNRAAIQMREFENDRPFLIVGETADDYLGEYMAGGVVVVLNLSDSDKPARNYIGTGMVGGRIYVRGRVKEEQIGLLPQREDVLRYLHTQTLDGTLSKDVYDRIARAAYPSVELLSRELPPALLARVLLLFFATKYTKPISVARRRLSPEDIDFIGDGLRAFFKAFALPDQTMEKVLASEFTVIQAKEERKSDMHVPPQEVPVEE